MWYHGNLNDDVMNCWHSLSQWNNAIQLTNSQFVWFSYCWCHSAIASCLLAMAVFSIYVLKYHIHLYIGIMTLSRVSFQMTNELLPHTMPKSKIHSCVMYTLYSVHRYVRYAFRMYMFNQKTCCHPCMPLTPGRTTFLVEVLYGQF